ncbi:DUF6950 family protein [Candidatus Palauibacter sp.]|uniref:DUF6950 family protein n=1 Tax=Candidatus Palauibacter sp. TaxID=3101350 RepID=UPI003CC670B0
MRGVRAVLDGMAGPYVWGETDCLRLAERIAALAGHEPWVDARLAELGVSTEREARRLARRYPTPAAAYGAVLDVGPWRRHPGRPRHGDLVLVDWPFPLAVGRSSPDGHLWDGARRPAVGIALDGLVFVTGRHGFLTAGPVPAGVTAVWRLDRSPP